MRQPNFSTSGLVESMPTLQVAMFSELFRSSSTLTKRIFPPTTLSVVAVHIKASYGFKFIFIDWKIYFGIRIKLIGVENSPKLVDMFYQRNQQIAYQAGLFLLL